MKCIKGFAWGCASGLLFFASGLLLGVLVLAAMELHFGFLLYLIDGSGWPEVRAALLFTLFGGVFGAGIGAVKSQCKHPASYKPLRTWRA